MTWIISFYPYQDGAVASVFFADEVAATAFADGLNALPTAAYLQGGEGPIRAREVKPLTLQEALDEFAGLWDL